MNFTTQKQKIKAITAKTLVTGIDVGSEKELSVKNKAIKYRIYPTTEQAELFAKTFGCCRKVYNLMLSDKIDSFRESAVFFLESFFLLFFVI